MVLVGFCFVFAVMRLTKPTLFTNIPVTCEERDLPGKSFLLTEYYVLPSLSSVTI